MTPGLTVLLAGIEFTGRRFRWEPGVYVVTFDGHDGGGETAFQSIPSGAGILDTGNRRESPRIFTITGFIFERSEWALQQRIQELAALLGEDDDTADLVWQLNGESRWASVRRHRFPPPKRRRGPAAFADFTLSLRASDQRIYGDRIREGWGTAVEVDHFGGYPAPALIEVRGSSGTGYTITGPRGKIARVTRPIVDSAVHLYDGDTGVLRVAGVAQTSGVSRSDRIEIPVGAHQFTVDNGCELRVTFAPTWAP